MYLFLNLLFFVAVYCEPISVRNLQQAYHVNFDDNDYEVSNKGYITSGDIGVLKRRFKREVNIKKNDDETYAIHANKEINIDDDKLLKVTGNINGLKVGKAYEDVNAGVAYSDHRGDELNLYAEHSRDGDTKLSGQGTLNIFETPGKKLGATGFIEKEYLKNDQGTKYGGTLDLSTSGGSGAWLSVLHDSKIGDSLNANGKWNIIKDSDKSLDVQGSWAKNFPVDGLKPFSEKYGANVNFATSGGSGASLAVLHDSNVGDLLKANGKWNFIKDDDKTLDVQGSWVRVSPLTGLGHVSNTYGGSIKYAHRNGDSASIAAAHLPEFGDQLSATGKFNLFHNNDHNLEASGKIARNFPIDRSISDFNTYSGNVDYTYKNRFGLGLGADYSGLGRRTDLLASTNFNLFRDKDTSFDFGAGIRKTFSPSFNSPMSPYFGLTFKKSFK